MTAYESMVFKLSTFKKNVLGYVLNVDRSVVY